jgi:hypothetical protein
MPRALNNLPWLAATATLCATAMLFPAARSQQSAPSSAASLANNHAIYFPKGTVDRFADFYSSYLNSIHEPSLLASAQEANTVSYRLVCMDCTKRNLLVIRLSLNPDGKATIVTTTSTLNLSVVPSINDTTQDTVTATAAEVDQFYRLIEKANFWSMPTDEPEDPDPHRKVYKVHAGHWMFEAARRGSYHVVFREGPEQSPFTEMVRFLARDLAKLNESLIPRASPPQGGAGGPDDKS